MSYDREPAGPTWLDRSQRPGDRRGAAGRVAAVRRRGVDTGTPGRADRTVRATLRRRRGVDRDGRNARRPGAVRFERPDRRAIVPPRLAGPAPTPNQAR